MFSADEWIEAARVVIANAKADPLNNAVMPLIGIVCIYLAYRYWHLPWSFIKMFFFHGLL